jgi:hypothetical protein
MTSPTASAYDPRWLGGVTRRFQDCRCCVVHPPAWLGPLPSWRRTALGCGGGSIRVDDVHTGPDHRARDRVQKSQEA